MLSALIAGWLVSCSTAPPTAETRNQLLEQATALFPEVAKGELVFGGAYGRGVVYEQGQVVDYADLTQASFGLQLGGQTYSELIVVGADSLRPLTAHRREGMNQRVGERLRLVLPAQWSPW